MRSATKLSRLVLFVLYVSAREAPFAKRSRAHAAPILYLGEWMLIMMDVSAIGSYPPEAPVIRASRPLISLSITMVEEDVVCCGPLLYVQSRLYTY